MDDNTLASKGIGDVSIKRKNGENSLIKDVFYILEIKCNLVSISQFLERNYKIHMENKVLKFMDENGSLILKGHTTHKKTLKI